MRRFKASIASIVVGVIALAMIIAGSSLLKDAADARALVQKLSEHGKTATVSDARVKVFQGSDGERRVYEVEVTFDSSDGTVKTRLRTTPTIHVAIFGSNGWEDTFEGKENIVGATVKYIPGTPPIVELKSEVSTQEHAPLGFSDILGIGLCSMGGLIILIVTVSALRSRREIE